MADLNDRTNNYFSQAAYKQPGDDEEQSRSRLRILNAKLKANPIIGLGRCTGRQCTATCTFMLCFVYRPSLMSAL